MKFEKVPPYAFNIRSRKTEATLGNPSVNTTEAAVDLIAPQF